VADSSQLTVRKGDLFEARGVVRKAAAELPHSISGFVSANVQTEEN
jgi:hypothetical protein